MRAAIAELLARHAHETRALQTELHVVSRRESARAAGAPRAATAHTATCSSSAQLELRRLREVLEDQLQQQHARHVAAQRLNQHRLKQLFARQVGQEAMQARAGEMG
jgi:hypothetical protein